MSKSPSLHAVSNTGSSAGPTQADLLAASFPDVDPEFTPFHSRVLVQFRTPMPYIVLKNGTKFHLPDDAVETEKWNTQVAKVIAFGPMAFHHRQTGLPWPEGNWAHVGDFVRVPKYGTGDRWELAYGDAGQRVMFALYNDLDLMGAVKGDPLRVKAFL